MSRVLRKLRGDLDLLPSPVPDRPGLLLRDPFRYSDAVMIVPPLLVRCLPCFDGAHTDLDLHQLIADLTSRLDLGDAADGLARALSEAGFLDDQIFEGMRTRCHDQFARSSLRPAAFAGGGYPADGPVLSQTISEWIGGAPAEPQMQMEMQIDASSREDVAQPRARADMVAIAAPHVSPQGGVAAYGAAYRELGPELHDRTFVVLGTSHYGQPNRFGLTHKSFRTPFGDAATDTALVDELVRSAGPGMVLEDYCHAVEHSIEFQVLFLQSLYGPSVRILPILCGPFAASFADDPRARPEDDPDVARALDGLRDLCARHGRRLFWVLGVDLAHVGRRYGDADDAQAHEGALHDVEERDRARLDRIVEGDAEGFWHLAHDRGRDDLKWCGASPLYTFLRLHPTVRGQILRYDQWNIDAHSVVTFAALTFRGANLSPEQANGSPSTPHG